MKIKESKMKIKESKKSDEEGQVEKIVGATTQAKPGELHFLVKVSGEEDIHDNSGDLIQF